MSLFHDQTAVVAGASGAIGGAIARRLAVEGATLLLLGRDPERLDAVLTQVSEASPSSEAMAVDLTLDDLAGLRGKLEALERIDVLVHCQGFFAAGPVAGLPLEEVEELFAVNVVSALRLTRLCLPLLLEGPTGQIVFMNSSAGLRARAGVGAYAASKHALRAVADSLRDEVNGRGIRVLSVFPGRTASRMQQEVCRRLGETYDPERLMQPPDVAGMVVEALATPRSAEVTDIRMRPMRGAS